MERPAEFIGLDSEITHKHPVETEPNEYGARMHRLELHIGDAPVGYAELAYLGKPVPTYYLDYMHVDPQYRGVGFGSELIDQINAFIKSKGKMGLLINGISEGSPATGIYLSHGWTETANSSVLVYNVPEGVGEVELKRVRKHLDQWLDKTQGELDEAA